LVRTYTERERDFPFGMTGPEVQAEAIRIAEATVQEMVRSEIQAQIDSISCEEPCQKDVRDFIVALEGQTQVTVSTGSGWDTYSATATAKGSATVECVATG
jgi:hypothetical protein